MLLNTTVGKGARGTNWSGQNWLRQSNAMSPHKVVLYIHMLYYYFRPWRLRPEPFWLMVQQDFQMAHCLPTHSAHLVLPKAVGTQKSTCCCCCNEADK